MPYSGKKIRVFVFRSSVFGLRSSVFVLWTPNERIGESALKSHMKGEKHKRNTCATSGLTQSLLMSTFLHKEVSSSCVQWSESTSSCAEASNDEFSVPPPPSEADG